MPSELVLLSEVEPTTEALTTIAARLHPDGSYVEFRGGEIKQFVDAQAKPLLCVFRTRVVSERREAAAAVMNPPTAFALWTDLTVPFDDDGAGRALAEAVAAGIGGVIKERV